jgi:hypothetical protein
MRIDHLDPVFVEFIPESLEPEKLYISMQYAVTAHMCPSGCGNKIFLPLSPAQWNMQFDGVGVSISPSVGNWEYPCRSHYFITNNEIQWAGDLDQASADAGRISDQNAIDQQLANAAASHRTLLSKTIEWLKSRFSKK